MMLLLQKKVKGDETKNIINKREINTKQSKTLPKTARIYLQNALTLSSNRCSLPSEWHCWRIIRISYRVWHNKPIKVKISRLAIHDENEKR
jgi:hypothetical protein